MSANSKENTWRDPGGYLRALFIPNMGDNRTVGIAATGTIKDNRFGTVTVRIGNGLINSGVSNRGLVRWCCDRNDLTRRVSASISIIDSEHRSVRAFIRISMNDRLTRVAVAVTKVPGICERVTVRVA